MFWQRLPRLVDRYRRGALLLWQRLPSLIGRYKPHRLRVVSVGDPASFGGIVRIELAISPSVQSGATLRAAAGAVMDSEMGLGPVEAGQTLSVHVHFHLLPPGQQMLRFALHESDGTVSTVEASLDIENHGTLVGETARLLRAHGTPLFFVGACDASMYGYDAHTAWFDRPDADRHIESMLERGDISEQEAGHLRHFVEHGYMVIENLLDDALIDRVNKEIDDAVARKYQGYENGSSQRLELLHLHYEGIRKLWLDSRHLRFANLVFNAQARPCQTLTYVYGSQQDAHQDTVHLTPFPAGYMCGTWIALQDVVADSGELIVYPGSHREKRVRLRETGCAKVNGNWDEFLRTVGAQWAGMIERHKPTVYRPKKGTVLIWHENLLHAGSVRKDQSLERRSIVIHSFADGAVVYYDSTGLNGSAVTRKALQPA